MKLDEVVVPGLDLGLNEVTAIACWYLWWIRQQQTHEEPVPPIYKCKMSILNTVKALSRMTPSVIARWSRPKPRQVKLNVDASFHADLYKELLEPFSATTKAISLLHLVLILQMWPLLWRKFWLCGKVSP